jgi:hypothetical protein
MGPTLKSRKTIRNAVGLGAAAVFCVQIAVAGEWTVETVDQSGSGRFASMKIDRKGNVHIAYIPEEERHPLKYAFWDHALQRWFTMQIAQYASFCSLTLDSNQRPHISYADHGSGKGAKLRYIYWPGGADWKSQPVSPAGDGVVAYYTSIALDARDKPVFSYYDYEGPGGVGFLLRLRTVVWADNYWEVQMVDRGSGSGKFNSIALDSAGHPQIAYANVKAETSGLRYARWTGSSWETEILEGQLGPTPVYSVAMALDANDKPHIAYTDVDKRVVKYATRLNGDWQLETIDSIRKEGYPDRHGITLDEAGNPYISYYDAGDGVLKVAWRNRGKWRTETVARDYQGFTGSLAIHDGVLWVAFADDPGGGLKVARRKLDTPAGSAALPVLSNATEK